MAKSLFDHRGGVEDIRLEDKAKAQDKKNSEAKAKDNPFEDKPSRGQGQECSRPRTTDTGASVLQKNQAISKTKQRSSKKFLLVLELRSRSLYVQAYADDLTVLVSGADILWILGMQWRRGPKMGPGQLNYDGFPVL